MWVQSVRGRQRPVIFTCNHWSFEQFFSLFYNLLHFNHVSVNLDQRPWKSQEPTTTQHFLQGIMLAWQPLVSFVCTKKEPTASQVNKLWSLLPNSLVSKYPNSQEGILVYPSEEMTGHSCKDVWCSKGWFALSQDIQCQSQCSSGSTFPLTDVSTWKHLESVLTWESWPEVGEGSTWTKCVRQQMSAWAQADRTHIFSSCNITVCAGTQLFLHLDDVSLCGWHRNVQLHSSGF